MCHQFYLDPRLLTKEGRIWARGGLEGGGQRKLGNCGFVASLIEPLTSVAVAEAFFDRENFNIQEDVR